MTYTPETELLMNCCKEQGFNIWPLIGIFKKRSRLNTELPDEVIQAVCKEYLGRMREIRADFPYFLKVLEIKSRDYFSKREISIHNKIRKEPMAFKDILREIMK